ncbi:MAG: hypothetical protein PHC62_00675 [Candidatus Izemoplasmatales bacterium]|nr:hypothetical protein [Candidatus Izemoplasmatales bacterium]
MIPYNKYYIPKFNIESLIYSNYIKYDQLKDWIIMKFKDSPEANCTHINFFIDVYSMIRGFYRRQDFHINDGQEYTLASGIINMAAHYREYFRSRHNTKADIYIVSSFNMNKYLTSIHPSYRSVVTANDEITDYIAENMKVLDSLVPYLPGMYFKHYDHNITGAAILDIIRYNESHGNKDPNIILSKDFVVSQIVCNPISRTMVLRPYKNYKKTYEGTESVDLSYLVEHGDLMVRYGVDCMKGTKVSEEIIEKRLDKINALSPELLSVLMAITKSSEYGYGSELLFPAAINILYKLIVEDKLALNQYNTNINDLMTLISMNTTKQVDPHELIKRFRTLDLMYQYNNMVSMNLERYQFVDDLYNPDMVKMINEKFFKECPLDLNVL